VGKDTTETRSDPSVPGSEFAPTVDDGEDVETEMQGGGE